jgi:hypothetical protein
MKTPKHYQLHINENLPKQGTNIKGPAFQAFEVNPHHSKLNSLRTSIA